MTKKLLKIQNQPFSITQSILSLYSALRPCFQQIWIVLDNTLMVNREQCQKNDIHYQYVSFLAGIPPKNRSNSGKSVFSHNSPVCYPN